ncbi:MAG: zinc-binding alcohol dehydrogenase [Oscillospiraceae bacterium]|nr:zinc-binding alcohol dehydrogenase [Oscillospiraceae bacterium]
MLKELLLNDDYRPQLFTYKQKPLQAGCVRVQSIFGSPKHGTELTRIASKPFEEQYYDEHLRIFLKRETSQSVKHSGLGNMWVGAITEIAPDVTGFAVGQRVAGYGHLANTHDVPAENLLTMPENMTWQEAVCYDPVQYALSGLRDASARVGDVVLVSGLGAIGLMAAQIAKLSGASLVAVSDPIELRRKAALENGADFAYDPKKDDFGLLMRKHTQGRGADAVIETSGNYMAVEQCIRALGFMGNMALVGWFNECRVPIHFGREGHFNQQNIFFSRATSEPNRDFPRWDFIRICQESWNLLTAGKIRCENVVAPIVDFDECDRSYTHYIIENPQDSIKMGVRF